MDSLRYKMFVILICVLLLSPYADSSFRPIMNGKIADEGAHPHMVNLSTGGVIRTYLCGGSLISKRTVLTAAHCVRAMYVNGSLVESLRATVGSNNRNTEGTSYTLLRNVSHPNYVEQENKNDISLLITTHRVEMTSLVSSVYVSYDVIGPGVPVVVAGWGDTDLWGTKPITLMELEVITLDNFRCAIEVAEASTHFKDVAFKLEPHIEFCTYHLPGFGTCRGDSGSPLTRRSDGVQIGVVSWGFPCARGAPDVYTRLSAFEDFIRTNIH
ncbi:chymotrypsin-1-like [Anticarsia gemmatalis]|uniref:chymotrypsin-1-like n=1 Tax=Anticarsia gemmatalis TaxID=129554 RepID=UPI003F7647A2